MSNNRGSSNQRFLPHTVQTFLWGRAREQPNDVTGSQQGLTPVNPTGAAPPLAGARTRDDSDARSDSSMPDLLSDGWSDSDSSQDARDVEMDIVADDDDDDDWVDEDEMPPHLSAFPTDQAQATDRRARVETEVEPHPSQPDLTPNPAPLPRSHTGAGPSQPFPTLPPWNFGLGTPLPPGRLFPLFPNPPGSSGNESNPTPHRYNTTPNPHPQPTQPPQPDRNSAPENPQQNARGPRFHAHTFVLGMDGTGRAVPIPPGAFSTMFNQFRPAMPQSQAQTPQPGHAPDQSGEDRDQPRQPGDPGQIPPFVDFVVGGIGTFPPFFATPAGTGPQSPADDPGNGGGHEPGRGAPPWAEFLRAMLGGEPPEEREDPERAKKLVKGLEHIPLGLVRRMTRVESVPGAHEDSTGTTDGEVPGCAICWDSLLPEDSAENTKPPPDSATFPTSEHSTDSSGSKPVVSDPTPDDDTSVAIICLPCSHVFHASCLTPWFSKPKHTTCPTCRFDIDPRNLTYAPPRRSHPAPATNTTTPSNPQPEPIPDSTTSAGNPPTTPPTTHQGQDHEHRPPPDSVADGHSRNPDVHVEPPVFIPDFFAAHPQRTFFDMFRGPATSQTQEHNNGDREQQGHDQLPGETWNETPDSGNNIPPPIFGFGFGPQQPPAFGPPLPPDHPARSARAAATNAPPDHGNGPQPEAGPNFARGVGHAHLEAPGIAVDFTLHVPPEHGMDPERISQVVRDQAAAFLRFFAGGGGGPGMGQPAGQAPTPGPGGVNHVPETLPEWMPPSAPGPTLRQRVEAKERQAGLRCDDPSCGVGPSDEDPFPAVFSDPNSPSIKRVGILKEAGEEAVCDHVFHPACLVSADRCAGWGERDRPASNGSGEYEVVSCPVCRSVGKVQGEVWEEGAKALLV